MAERMQVGPARRRIKEPIGREKNCLLNRMYSYVGSPLSTVRFLQASRASAGRMIRSGSVPVSLYVLSFCQRGVHPKEKRLLTGTGTLYRVNTGGKRAIFCSGYLFVLTTGRRYSQGQELQEVVNASQERA